MTQITAQVPDDLGHALDVAAAQFNQSRDEIVRLALEQYLLDLEDIASMEERLNDATDPILDWEDVKRELFGTDEGQRN